MIRCFAMAVFLWSALAAVASDPLDSWHWRTPLPQGYSLNGTAVGANLRIAVGELGTVLVSSNGIDWLVTNAPVVTNLNAVCFTGDRFVAVGDGGTILTSTTGISWTLRNSPTTNHLYSVTYGGGLLVAVGARGAIVISPNGSSWTVRDGNLEATAQMGDVVFGAGRFVTVGRAFHEDFYYGISASSTDGNNWQSAAGLAPFSSVAFGNGTFLATSGDQFAISADGLQWAYYYLGLATNASALAFTAGRFVAVGSLGVMLSIDGTNWIAASGVSGSFRDIAVRGDDGVAVGSVGSLASTSNMTHWTMISSGVNGYLRAMIFGKDRFVGVGGPTIFTSIGGRAWTRQTVGSSSSTPLPTASLDSVAYGKGIFIAVGGHYFPLTNVISTDGISWTPLPIPVTNALAAIAFVNDRFVAGGDAGTICDSIDGTNWTTHFIPDGVRIGSVAYGQSRYVAAGAGAIYASTDLENWTFQGGTNVNWAAVTHGNGMFVAGGVVQYGKTGIPALRSLDGLTWEPAATPPGYISDLAFGRGTFVAAAGEGIVTSTNGLNWALRKSRPFPAAQTVAFGLETFVVNRFEGGIVQSDEVVPAPRLNAFGYANGQFQMSMFTGVTGSTYSVQSTVDLKDWADETTVVPLQFPFAITNQSLVPSRFYRAVGQ